jgi:transposase
VTDVVGLYRPPDKNLVLCIDEKSQIQAIDRSQPGRAATMTHDYKRDRTTTLFAALDVKIGLFVGECLPRHRAKEFLRFLRKLHRATKKEPRFHLLLHNYATHKTPEVKAWLEKHSRFHLHFTPKGASWMSLVERLFAEITTKRLCRGVFRSVGEVEDAIATMSTGTTPTRSHSSGPRPPTPSSPRSAAYWRSRRSPWRGANRLSQNTSELPD